MAIHMAGFGETIDANATTVNITALADQYLATSGDDLTVPELNQILWAAAGVSTGGSEFARLISPSLRRLGNRYITPANGGNDGDVEPGSPPSVIDFRNNPLQLVQTENLNAEINSQTSAAAFQWVLFALTDGNNPAVPAGEPLTARFTNTDTLTVDVFTAGNLTAAEDLDSGTYSVIGMSARSAGLVAARLIPRGGGARPGCLGADDPEDLDSPLFRMGGLGAEWLQFTTTELPAVEFLSISADSSQVVYLDLIKLSDEV